MLTLIDLNLPKDIVDSTTLSQKIHSENFIPVEHALPPLITFDVVLQLKTNSLS